jgi:hypothetical protein
MTNAGRNQSLDMTSQKIAPTSSAAHALPKEAFSEDSLAVEITPAEREIGLKTKRYFDRTLKRKTPWLIKNGKISVEKGTLAPTALEQNPGGEQLASLTSGEISTERLSTESISPVLASVLLTFKRIEDKLPDFSGRSNTFFRNIWGINNSYHQWSYEENQHSDAIGLILQATGSNTQDELDADYYQNLAITWEAPFPTGRMMVLYAAFQEQMTSLSYHALVKRATEEGAPTVAEIMKLVAQDEAYHGGGYRAFSRIYFEQDPEGTVADALHVAANFRMPAQHLMRDRRRNSMEIVRVGAFSKEMVSEETLFKVLMGLRFVPEADAKRVAANYWKGSAAS